MVQRNVKYYLVFLFGVALLLRLVLVVAHPVTNLPDSRDYDLLARQILHGQPYQVTLPWGAPGQAARMPGYPLLIAALYAVGGEHPWVVLGVQAVLGAACVPLAYLLARRMSVAAGLVAAGLTALDPLGILFSAALLSETAFTLALLSFIVILVRLSATRRPLRGALLCGVLAAAAIYLRPSVLWLVLALPALLAMVGGRRGLAAGATVVLVVLLLLLPWQIRNHQLLGMSYSHLTTLEGICLYDSVGPQATGAAIEDKVVVPPDMAPLNEAQRDAQWGQRGWQCVREDPARILRLAPLKFGRTWSPWLNAADYQVPLVNLALTLWHVPVYVLALLGLVWGWRGAGGQRPRELSTGAPRLSGTPTEAVETAGTRRLWYLAVLAPIVYFALVHTLFFGSVRYRVPLMPLVYVWAAAGAVPVLRWRPRERT